MILFVIAFMPCNKVNSRRIIGRATNEKFAAVGDKAFFRALLTTVINMREWQLRSFQECDESAIGFSTRRHEKSVSEEPVSLSDARESTLFCVKIVGYLRNT